jgi:2-polyprenyl-6-methoxyphenol hydroxylase-like FAD-dependent oxidoreductase
MAINDSSARPVLIAGGGIGGCAAALALAQRGIASQILEQAPQFGEIGAGIQLGPNAFRVFERLGLTDEIKNLVAYPDNLVMMDAVTAQKVTGMPLGDQFLDRFGEPYAVIYRADLHEVLLDACRASPLVDLRTGVKIVSFNDDGRGVDVATEAGTHHEGRALIGADGLWSKVRDLVVGDGKPRISGHIAYRAVLPTADVPEELRFNDMTLWAGPKFHLVQYPLRRGELYNLVAVFHSDRYEEGWNTYGDTAELNLRFEKACPQVKKLLSKIETWRMWVLCDRDPIAEWSKGRVTLLGDAAHPMLQYMAQGACMALEDAVSLAAHCADASTNTSTGGVDTDFEAAFLAYQQERYLRTCRVQLMARVYGDAYHASGAVADLRNTMLRKRTVEQGYQSLAWLYDPIEGAAA